MRCTPPFLGKAMGGLALSQTKLQIKRPEQSPMGIIPSGMIPHWEPRAKSIQYIHNSLVQG